MFIDDIRENVDAANGVGITGILFTDVETLERDLSRLGITVH